MRVGVAEEVLAVCCWDAKGKVDKNMGTDRKRAKILCRMQMTMII